MFYWVVLGFTEYNWNSLGFTVLYWVVLGFYCFSGLLLVLLGFPVFFFISSLTGRWKDFLTVNGKWNKIKKKIRFVISCSSMSSFPGTV